MAGNSQGIVVSIQAKIEGWQNLLKLIQDSLKNLKVGSALSKDLSKELKQFESMINNLGKNLNQRLTSDSQITSLTDKLKDVDNLLASMGQRMSSVTFTDMDPSYITNNFKDLIDVIELAEDVLATGMANSFLSAISESDNLQKAFAKLKIDPSAMGADELKALLETKSSDLGKEIEKANEKITNLRSNAKAAKLTMEDMQKLKIMQVSDTKAEAKTIVGDTSGLGLKSVNSEYLKELEQRINDVLTNGGVKLEEKLKSKRALIDLAIKDLVNALSVEEARKKIQELENLFADVKAKGVFDQGIKINTITDDKLTSWIPNSDAVRAKLDEIKSTLETYKIDPKILDGLKLDELFLLGNFDKVAEVIRKALEKAKEVTEKEITDIDTSFKKLRLLANDEQKSVMSKSATKYNVDLGLSKWDEMLLKVLEDNQLLRAEVETLKKLLENRATASFRDTGNKMAASGALGIAESNNLAKAYEALLGRVKAAEQALGKLLGVVQRWFSIYAVVRMVSNAVRTMINTIKELDKTITNIAIVTDMSQDDLWKQMPKYTEMARDFASSIAGVYEVSQLYYQLGLLMAEVMSLTEATLKMARISGLGYADATDYMTNAVRSFKMEMSEATTVVDVYSAVAASSATSVTELATAMSKTASSALAVGASFLNTTAMMAVMIEATRESPENIGSALKSIISRYGELKENITGTDSEGEEYSLNKVDKALLSVGISIHDAKGEFRDFDDVILELADSWDTIDKNTQRYIATVMAGNRQQSRFLALVSSGARLRELSDEAANSENASQLQFLKSLDSIDSKVQLLLTSILALYTNSGLEQAYKGFLDFANRIVTTLDNISNNLGLLGVGAKIVSVFTAAATLVTNLFTTVKLKFAMMQSEITAKALLEAAKLFEAEKWAAWNAAVEKEKSLAEIQRAEAEYYAAKDELRNKDLLKENTATLKAASIKMKGSMLASAAGLALTTAAASMDVNTLRTEKAWLTGAGSALSGIGTGFMMGGWVGAIVGGLTALPGIIEAIGMASESVTEKITRLKTDITNAENKAIVSKDELKTLELYEEKLKELASKQYDSNEDRQAFLDLSNEIANKYPELISYIDEEGNKIVELGEAYTTLKEKKLEAYTADAISASAARVRAASDAHYRLELAGITAPERKKDFWIETGDFLGAIVNKFAATGISHGNAKIFSQSGSAFDHIANNLANYSFASSMSNASNSGYGAGSDWDTMLAVFGISKVIPLSMLSLELSLSSANMSLDISALNSILNQGNISASMGRLVDILMELNATKNLINTILSSLFGEEVKINEELYNYRILVLSSEKATKGSAKLIKQENKNLYSTIISQDKYDISDGLENAFLQFDFLKRWEQLAEGLTEDEIGPAWEAFALAAEENMDEIISNYESMISNITDIDFKTLLGDMFKNPSSYTQKEWESLKDSVLATNNLKLIDFVDEYYTEQIKHASDNFIKACQNMFTRYDFTGYSRYSFISKNISGEFLSGILELYETIMKNSNILNKNSIIDLLDSLYIAASKLDYDNRNKFITKINTADLTSFDGIYSLIDEVSSLTIDSKKKDELKNLLLQFSDTLVINLTTSFNSFSEDLISASEDFDKALSKASKGMNLKEASELADKLSLNLSDFTFKDGKYYYDVVDAPLKILEAYFAYNLELKTRLDEEYNNLTEAKSGLLSRVISTKSGRQYPSNTGGVLPEKVSLLDFMEGHAELGEDWAKIEDLTERMQKIRDLGLSSSLINDKDLQEVIDLYDLYYDAWNSLKNTEGGITSLNQYVLDQLKASHDNMTAAIDQYGAYEVNAILILNGYITAFLNNISDSMVAQGKEALTEEQIATLSNAILSGKTEGLEEELKPYAKLIYDTFHSVRSSIVNAMIASVGGNGTTKFAVTDANKGLLEQLLKDHPDWINGTVETGQMVEIAADKLAASSEEFLKYIVASFETTAEKIKALSEYHKNKYSNNKTSSLNAVIEDSTFSYEEMLNYLTNNHNVELNEANMEKIPTFMNAMGLAFNSVGEVIVVNYEKWIADLQWTVANLDKNASIEEINAAKTKLINALNLLKTALISAFKDIFKNYNAVTYEQRESLANSLHIDIEKLTNYFRDNGDGTSRLNITKLLLDIKDKVLDVQDGVIDSLNEVVAEVTDDYRKNITTAMNLVTKGTTNSKDIEAFKNIYKNITNTELAEGAFKYDELVSAWTLDPTILKDFINKQAEQLGLQGQEAKQFIFDLTTKVLALAVDITSYLKAENLSETSTATLTLRNLLLNWATSHYGIAASESTLDYWILQLLLGGNAAVEIALKIAKDAGLELTQAEIEQIYSPMTNRLINLASSLENLTEDQYVADGELKEILREAKMIDTSGLVTNINNIVSAYDIIINQLKLLSGSTATQVNEIAAKKLTALEQKDIDAIAVMGEAMSMTYSSLGQILGKEGIELEKWLQGNQDMYEHIGGGKIRLTDFTAFAELRGWVPGSEEYTKAFKTYNDSIISVDNAVEKSILEEVQSALKAKPGDKVNLTWLANLLHIAAGEVWLFTGALLKDGILSIEKDANIATVTSQLIALAKSSTEDIEEELEDLAYAVQQLLADIANTIKSGIGGSLKQDEAKKVTDWASQYGVKVDFNETAEGLLITNNSARELYSTINTIDRLLGQVVFEALKDNLIKTDERFQSASANVAYIAKLERDITKEITKKNNNDKFDDTKINQYKKELELAQKINETRGLTEDSSFKFMEQDIPSGLKNPLNYWSNWGKAFTVMNESRTNGTMAYEDFRNIITEMGNLVDITEDAIQLGDQTLENSEKAASLIEAAAGALEVQTDGSLKVNLKKIGVEFLTGSESMTNGIDKGIQEIANSLIEMLDSLIGLLEVIVLMEQLGDIDLDKSGTLEIGELFELDAEGNIKDFQKKFNDLRLGIIDVITDPDAANYNADLDRGLSSIKIAINGQVKSLKDIVKMNIQDIKDTFGSDGSIYTAIMQGIYMSVQSGDFSETNIKELVMLNLQKALLNYGGEITFDMGNYTFIGSGNATFEIDWTAENTKNALEQFKGSVEEKEALLIAAYQAMGKGTANATLLTAALIANGTLEITPGETTKIVAVDANGEEYIYDVPTNSNEPIPAEYMAALGASMLQKLGATNVHMDDIDAGTATGQMIFGNTIFDVVTLNGLIKYQSKKTGKLCNSIQDAIAADVDYELKNDKQYENYTETLIEEERIRLTYAAEVEAGIASFDLNSLSYLTINAKVRKKLEEALASGNRAEVDIVINGNPELASLKGLSSQEIEEKLGIKLIPIKIAGDVQEADTKLTTVQEKLTLLINDKDQTISIEMHATNYGTTVSALNTINDLLREIAANRNQLINITTVKTTIENESKKPGSKKLPNSDNLHYEKGAGATGNVALSKGTLMGELGPELVVSKGRYYIVGQNGPEFVDLEEDAIVFNHLLTKSLLQRGITFGRGAPVTNERNAVALAGGNITGPAMASASSILSILKELRAMWKSLLNSSTKDLASLGGSGGGGGGGGSNKDNAAKAAEFTKELEMWYNWLQKIASLGQKLSYEEKKRAKIASDMYAHGQDYTKSQLDSLTYLQQLIVVEKSLVNSLQAYFDKRRKELNDSTNPFSALYTFDDDGLLKYANGALTAFSKLLSTNEYGKPKYTAEDQYNVLVSAGFGEYMKYNSSGEEITKETNDDGTEKEDLGTFYTNSIQAFWDKVDADKEEMQSLHDSIEEHKEAILEAQTEANEIMKEIEDNQISVEEKVLKAIEDTREREIEELQDTRDAMEKAANELISGLSDLLSKEKDMYALQESQDELTKLQRQLAILLRSGGSASQIANLLREITLKQLDAYFEALQRLIDALQEASDAELTRLDNLIDLMTETLAYEKQYGLLWDLVYQVMQGTPEEISDFIILNTRDYWGESPTKLTLDTREIMFQAQLWAAFRDSVPGGIDELAAKFGEQTLDLLAAEETDRMTQAIDEANNNMTAAALSIVDAIDKIEVSPVVKVEVSQPASTGGDTGSGTGTGATLPTGGGTSTKKGYKITGVDKIFNTREEAEDYKRHLTNSAWNGWHLNEEDMDLYRKYLIWADRTVYETTYDRGGMVAKTGPALVHAKESVLTSEQTSILRNDILSNKPTSLLSLLTDFRDAYNSIPNASAYSTVNNGGVTIENATVEMNVSKIANDYDAQRAGEQALDKIMQIARKTSALNRIGR